MNRQAHFAALIARAKQRPNLIVHDGEAPLNADGTPFRASYVVLHDLGADDVGDARYTKAQTADSARTMRVVARCVGEDENAVRGVMDALSAQFIHWAPTVQGRHCWALVLDNESEIQNDDTVKPPLKFADLDFTYRTTPGA